jgi:hypothetical protein
MRQCSKWVGLSAVLVGLLGPLGATNADTLLVTSATTNEVYQYQVGPSGTPTLNQTLTANLDAPAGLAISPSNELFVANRHHGLFGGSVARFLDAAGNPVPNGTIPDDPSKPGFDFRAATNDAFRGHELFVVNQFAGNVLRFTFDASGQAMSNGIISVPGLIGAERGIVFSPKGDMFVSLLGATNSTPSTIDQWTFDSSGNATFLRGFTVVGAGVHGMAFAPWGELFLSDGYGNAIDRVLFDGAGNPLSNGTISGNGLNVPIGVSFSSWGELFVGNQGASIVSRFTFDASHDATADGTFSTPQTTTWLTFAPNAVPEPSSLVLAGLGLAGLAGYAGWRRVRSR